MSFHSAKEEDASVNEGDDGRVRGRRVPPDHFLMRDVNGNATLVPMVYTGGMLMFDCCLLYYFL